jgi:hypothetical protein
MNKDEYEDDGCGCCGRPLAKVPVSFAGARKLWCLDCAAHVDRYDGRPPWERTYAALHGGTPCPFDVAGAKPYNFAEVEAKKALASLAQQQAQEKEKQRP